ncbi:MAG: WGR domain-containing protein, partial [Bacteroidetes bacterium]|nr:WGR domain-containing protein [Bacteroidota bacterium]
NYVDKPRIKLVHSIARQTIINYQKKLKIKTAAAQASVDYSYSRHNYKPLGLELFRSKVEPKTGPLEFLLGQPLMAGQHFRFNPATGANDAEGDTRKKTAFELTDGQSNPYSWDFDLCNIVLGNFNYKKMSLVSDYNQVTEQQIDNPIFNELFSTSPRKPRKEHGQFGPSEWYHVIAADPTQTNAILHSRSGHSYIIQGPPGTGKSQTITNLVADFLAQGKSILFVCEKRAALDVVYHRLQQNNLAELCCYIHDSQGDKKEFVRDLKAVYEDFVSNKMDLPEISRQRKAALDRLQQGIEILQHYHDTQTGVPEESGIDTRRLLDRLLQLRQELPALSMEEQESMPNYQQWKDYGHTITQLGKALEDTGAGTALASHPFGRLGNGVIQSEQPFALIARLEEQVRTAIQQLQTAIAQNNIPSVHTEPLARIKNLVEDAAALAPLAQTGNLRLVNSNQPEARAFEEQYRQYQQLLRDYQQAQQTTAHWRQKFSRTELPGALDIAVRKEKSLLRFLSGDWRRLSKQLQTAYDFSGHQLKPTALTVLQQLQEEYAAQDRLNACQQQLQERYHVDNISNIYIGIEVLRRRQGDAELEYLLQHPDAATLVLQLLRLHSVWQQLDGALRQLLDNYLSKSLSQIQDEIASISANAESLQDVLPALRQFIQLPEDLQSALRRLPLTPAGAEAAMAQKTWAGILRQYPQYAGMAGKTLQETCRRIEATYKELLQLNSDYIRATRRQRFLHSYDISNMAASQLTPEQKQLKASYKEGRRVLEHEMGKTRSYKSIREMASDESGKVLRDIKPVWLMSPLSVSDSLPLDAGFFDVVIYDEASQITLEEGIPALFRAPQTIIVGDDKQMPPSNFFNAKTEDPNDLESFEGEQGDEILSSEADSLLVQGSRKLHSTMLSWHYRSRYETLISYSNHAFYEAGLLTIPDRTIHHNSRPAIEVLQAQQGADNAALILQNSISFHYLPNSVYESRSNIAEANYIAEMVRTLLLQDIPDTMGIVAFSQEQQGMIEDAIQRLADSDKAFDEALEKAMARKDEGQFTGLFIKNLENVQGDERDIIIMSVCYGHDAQRKMLMNFGPINRKGGERRLNVLFSRAKKHMAVVSSIKQQHITNDYNEGAAYFKRFLHYAEMVSTGSMREARRILDALVIKEEGGNAASPAPSSVITDTATKQLKQALEERGYIVDELIGQSSFKCTLGIKKQEGDVLYSLGVLVDDDRHYENQNLVEQYYQRPATLRAFGWTLLQVFAKDWLQDRGRVLEQVLQALEDDNAYDVKAEETAAAAKPAPMPVNITTLYSADGQLFWEIKQEEQRLLLRFGKKGSRGQAEIKSLASAEEAAAQKEALVAEKMKAGYRRS